MLKPLLVTLKVLLIVCNNCDVEARVHLTKDVVKNYENFIQAKSENFSSSNPKLASAARSDAEEKNYRWPKSEEGVNAGIHIHIPLTFTLPSIKINENDLENMENQLGESISEIFKSIVLKRLISEFSFKHLEYLMPSLDKLGQHNEILTYNDNESNASDTIKSNSGILDTVTKASTLLINKAVTNSRQKRDTLPGAATSKMESNVNKLNVKEEIKDDWGMTKDESKMHSKIVHPKDSKSSMNSNNRVSEIVIEQFGTRKNFADHPLKQFLGHRFGSIFSPRPTRGSLYNSGNENSKFHTSQSYPPTSFDDLELGTETTIEVSKGLEIPIRLGKLDSIFNALRLDSEECRKKVACEVSREATKYSPLAEIIEHETRVNGNLREIGRELLESSEGTRLLGYIEASTRGKDRYRQCDVYRFRCRKDISQMIDMDALVVWKEVVGWLTVKVLANGR